MQTPPPWQCDFRPHPTSKRICLTYKGNGCFLVTFPKRLPRREADAFVASRKNWMDRIASLPTPQIPTLENWLRLHPTLTLHGRNTPIRWTILPSKRMPNLDGPVEEILLWPNGEISLTRQLIVIANKALPSRTLTLATQTGITVSKVSVRNQRSRWGSCSSTGSISLNWRLILMPPQLQDHIILHELAHRIHMNHSTRFWKLLNTWDPETNHRRSELRKLEKTWLALAR